LPHLKVAYTKTNGSWGLVPLAAGDMRPRLVDLIGTIPEFDPNCSDPPGKHVADIYRALDQTPYEWCAVHGEGGDPKVMYFTMRRKAVHAKVSS
jgi:hypothetical protein